VFDFYINVCVVILHCDLLHYLVFCAAKMPHIYFRPRLQPGPRWGSLRRSSRPLSQLERNALTHSTPAYFVQCPSSATRQARNRDYLYVSCRLCRNGHVTGSSTDLLRGILAAESYQSPASVSAAAAEVGLGVTASASGSRPHRRHVVDVDTDCPRLFVVLPVSSDPLTLNDELRISTSTVLYDGYALHLLCEFPDGYHLTSAPGYRLRRPRQFIERYAGHVDVVLRLLATLATSPAVSLNYAARTRAVVRLADALVTDLASRYPAAVKPPPADTRTGNSQNVQHFSVRKSAIKSITNFD